MTAVRNIFWLVLATVSSIPRSTSAECCYSVSSKRVSSDSNGVVYSVALTASSQFAVDSPGMAYFAQVTFPSDFAIASVPTKCFSISSRVVSCTSTGSRRWTANFARITSKNKSSTTPKLDKVVVNGEQCGLKSSCRELKPSPVKSGPSTTTNSTTASVRITATSLTLIPTPTSTCPGKACPPPPTNGGNGDGSPSSNETYSRLSTGAIVGLAVGLVFFILISIFFCSRRRRKEGRSDSENQPRRRRPSSDRVDYEGGYHDEAMLEKGAGRRSSRRKNSVAFTEDPLRDGRSKFPYDASSIRTSLYGGSTVRSSRKGTSTSGKHKVGSPSSAGGTRKLKSIPEEYRRSEVSSFYDRSFYDTNYDPVTVEHQPLRTPRESRASSRGSPSNKSWVTTIASRNSRLFRSASSASSGLGRYSTQSRPSVQSDEPCCDQYHPPPPQQQQPRRPARSQDGITMTRQATSIRPPPKSVHRPPSRGDGSYTSSSYPAHQYEESDVDYLDVGKRSTLDNFEFYDDGPSMRNYQPPRGDQASGVPRNSQYMNPGQAPFPPPPSLSPPQPPTPAAQKPPQPERRGYVTPIHIRPQHHVNFLKEELRARDQQPAPYGYV